ncbi:hypothetical protein ANTQUA_LOCUS6096 [Anthophora quadrimaculata]
MDGGLLIFRIFQTRQGAPFRLNVWHPERQSTGGIDMGGRRAATDFKEVSLDAVNLVTYEKIERESGCHWLSAA